MRAVIHEFKVARLAVELEVLFPLLWMSESQNKLRPPRQLVIPLEAPKDS